jgi:uncharacterized FAD-dependent dehydrogenase
MVISPVEVFLPLDESEEALGETAARAAGIPHHEVARVEVLRRSLDARKGHPLGWRYQVRLIRIGEVAGSAEPKGLPPAPRASRPLTVVIVGAGPAGTFAALRLAEAGIAATLVERGKPVQPRRHDLKSLVARGELDPDSNYCFGEGGAGTFSDGKLYTRTKDRRAVEEVLKVLVRHGADPEIEIDWRPHIGSNRLPKILLALRADLEARGVHYIWSDPLVDLLIERGRMRAVRLRSGQELPADAVILAVGHSARPIYELCYRRDIPLRPKPFAVGARIEHPQPLIDRIQYGRAAGHPRLPPAFYHVTASIRGPGSGPERGVYSFCMCPGGWVVAASTESDGLCVNGMSLKRRDSPLANSALVVTVNPEDFGHTDVLGGLAFQQQLERLAFAQGGGGFRAPAQRVTDFLAGRPTETPLVSTYRPGVVGGHLGALFPPPVTAALREALGQFGRKLPGFASAEAQLVGVETRTSAPVRIERDPRSLQSPSVLGLFPCGEGAGHAGGIVSAAIDGLRVADALLGG